MKRWQHDGFSKIQISIEDMFVGFSQNLACIITTALVIVLTFKILPLTMGVDVVEFKAKINRTGCKCNCFDRMIKGPYNDFQGTSTSTNQSMSIMTKSGPTFSSSLSFTFTFI